jgi:hypothetical protein
MALSMGNFGEASPNSSEGSSLMEANSAAISYNGEKRGDNIKYLEKLKGEYSLK